MILSALCPKSSLEKKQNGFSLIEMAIVLVILGFLLGGLITPLTSQREISKRQAAERQLQEIRNALIGFAQVNNRFPCPVIAGDGGAPSVAGPCLPPAGPPIADRVPYAALGLQGDVINGNLLDPWGAPIHYRLTDVPAASWVYATAIPTSAAPLPDLRVCNALTCLDVPPPSQIIATEVVAVVFSTGPDGLDSPASISPDQLQNLSNGVDFVMRDNSGGYRTNIEFDDIVVWISQPALFYELSRAGQ
jgi:prepilin-type N-terminal cleavage/methylation domain-containing protein